MKKECKPSPKIGVAIITHKAKHHLARCLLPLIHSPLKPRVLVVNSSSNDGTVEMAQILGAETLVIPREKFNHGGTREEARRFLNTEIVCMLTPDAYVENEHTLEALVTPIIQGKSSIAYSRQIPHKGADFFESFPREYNYPSESHLRSIEDMHLYGVYTFFCSDSCAAYSNQALEEIGGFQSVLLGEDTVAVAKLLRKGHKIAYVAEAIVQHSHRYTLLEEFRRCFDTGLARKSYKSLLECSSCDSKRGVNYLKEMFDRLLKTSPSLLPYATAHIFAKWAGYQVGNMSVNAPLWLKKRLSTQDYYWSNDSNSKCK